MLIINFVEEVSDKIRTSNASFQYYFDPYGVGVTYFLTDNQKEILENQFEIIFDRDLSYWIDRAKLAIEQSSLQQANFYFKRYLKDKSNDAIIHYEFAKALFDQGKSDESIKHLEIGSKLLKDNTGMENESTSNSEWWLNMISDFKNKVESKANKI